MWEDLNIELMKHCLQNNFKKETLEYVNTLILLTEPMGHNKLIAVHVRCV